MRTELNFFSVTPIAFLFLIHLHLCSVSFNVALSGVHELIFFFALYSMLAWLLKECFDVLVPVILYLLNLSLKDLSVFPSSFALAYMADSIMSNWIITVIIGNSSSRKYVALSNFVT